MANLPDTTFFWRPRLGADDAWTEAPSGGFIPAPGAAVEVVSVGPSRIRSVVADMSPALVGTVPTQAFAAGAVTALNVSGVFSGSNLVYALTGAPAWATIDPATGILSADAPAATGPAGTWTVSAANSGGAPVSATFSVSVGVAAPRTIVFALAGQSNMVGRAVYDGLGSFPAGTLQVARTGSVSGGLDGDLVAAGQGLDHHDGAAGQMGLAVSFVNDWTAAHPADTVVLLPGADGGTGFNDSRWRAPSGDLYLDLVSRMNALFVANPGFVLGGLLWHQGESDMSAAVLPGQYQTYLDALIAGVRADVAAAGPDMPVVLGQMAPDFMAQNATYQGILDVIDATPSRIANTAVVSSAGLSTGDGTHFTAASYRIFGSRYGAAYPVATNRDAALPGAPTALSATANVGSVALSWAAPADQGVPDVNAYAIERRVPAGVWSAIGTIGGLSFNDASAAPETAYDYRVSAVNGAGTGAPSAAVGVTTLAAPAASGPVQVLAADHAENTGNLASYAFPGIATDDGIAIIAVSHRGGSGAALDVTGVTIGGASAVLLASESPVTQFETQLYWAAVSGASNDVVVTLNAATLRCGVRVWTVSPSADMASASVAGASTSSGSATDQSVTVTGADQGLILSYAAFVSSAESIASWTGAVEDMATLSVETSFKHGSASAELTADGAVTVSAVFTAGVSTPGLIAIAIPSA
jgi:hypothetical protein